jgi:hypothetical protein
MLTEPEQKNCGQIMKMRWRENVRDDGKCDDFAPYDFAHRKMLIFNWDIKSSSTFLMHFSCFIDPSQSYSDDSKNIPGNCNFLSFYCVELQTENEFKNNCRGKCIPKSEVFG